MSILGNIYYILPKVISTLVKRQPCVNHVGLYKCSLFLFEILFGTRKRVLLAFSGAKTKLSFFQILFFGTLCTQWW